MRELYRLLVAKKDWDPKEISAVSNTILNAVHSDILYIDDSHFLRATDVEDVDKVNIELWEDIKDEDGNISVRKVDCTKEEMLEVLHSKYQKEGKITTSSRRM